MYVRPFLKVRSPRAQAKLISSVGSIYQTTSPQPSHQLLTRPAGRPRTGWERLSGSPSSVASRPSCLFNRTSSASSHHWPSHRCQKSRSVNFLALRDLLSRPDPSLSFSFIVNQYTGRFSDDFIEARRGDLERWMRRVTRHPVVRYSDGVVGFLGVEECEVSLQRVAPTRRQSRKDAYLLFSCSSALRNGIRCIRLSLRTRMLGRSSTPSESHTLLLVLRSSSRAADRLPPVPSLASSIRRTTSTSRTRLQRSTSSRPTSLQSDEACNIFEKSW